MRTLLIQHITVRNLSWHQILAALLTTFAMLHANASWSPNQNTLRKLDVQFDCKGIKKPSNGEIPTPIYERILVCHRVWALTQNTLHLGRRADLSGLTFPLGDNESAAIKIETWIGEELSLPEWRNASGAANVDLSEANLEHIRYIWRKQPPRVSFSLTKLNGSEFAYANLQGANFHASECIKCRFFNVDLSNSSFQLATLTDAQLRSSSLSDADFSYANVGGFLFEPNLASMPRADLFAMSRNLKNLLPSNEKTGMAPLEKLKTDISKTGNTQAFREINYAIRSNKNSYQTDVAQFFNKLIFGVTCDYGLATERPLYLLALLIPIFHLIYFYSMTDKTKKNGIFAYWPKGVTGSTQDSEQYFQLTLQSPAPYRRSIRLLTEKQIHNESTEIALQARSVTSLRRRRNTKYHLKITPWLWSSGAVFMLILLSVYIFLLPHNYVERLPEWISHDRPNSTAIAVTFISIACILFPFCIPKKNLHLASKYCLWFSIINTFRFGWKDLSLGTWLSLLQRGEYVLKPSGWVRRVAGIQSLVGLLLLGLWAYCSFWGPIE